MVLTQEDILLGKELSFPEEPILWHNKSILDKYVLGLVLKATNNSNHRDLYAEIANNMYRFPYYIIDNDNAYTKLIYKDFLYTLMKQYISFSGLIIWDYYVYMYFFKKNKGTGTFCKFNGYTLEYHANKPDLQITFLGEKIEKNTFIKGINKCRLKNKKIVLPLGIYAMGTGHQNILVLDFNKSECIQIDPHGFSSYPEVIDKDIVSKLLLLCNEFNLELIVPLERECPFGLQLLEDYCKSVFKNTLITSSGLCATWTVLITSAYLESKDDIRKVEEEMAKYLKQKDCNIYKQILELNFNINYLILQDYPQLANYLLKSELDTDDMVNEKIKYVLKYLTIHSPTIKKMIF